MKLRTLLPSLLFVSLGAGYALAQTAKLPYQDPKLPAKERADDLVSRMTLEEKTSELINTSAEVPRLGVPKYDWWNEGLHGVARSGYATMFPQAIGMAAMWDTAEIGKIGDVISTEARAKNNEALRHDLHSIYYGLTFWSPNINIFRDPRWGRGQETYGEDPFLTSQLGVAFVRGLQGNDPRYYKVIATPKHFAVHSGPESERHKFNVEPSAHDLWETYLPAFRATIVDGQADSIMCAYNAIDGAPACANKMLLDQILRKDWGFDGFVTSDCGAVDDFYEKTAHKYSKDKDSAAVAGIEAGTDTNCGNTYLALTEAVQKGLISESALDISLERLFTARFKLGLFDPKSMVPYDAIPFSEVASPAHHALALDAAEKAIVLLKNDDHTLPLRAGLKTIAVVGPNAAALSAIEGNYNAVPKNYEFPVDALVKAMPGTRVLYAQGAPYADGVVLPVPRTMFHTHGVVGEEGLKAEYFAGDSTDGKPVLSRVDKQIDFDWNAASPVTGVSADHFSVRWTGTITAPQAGTYDFTMRLAHCYPCGDREKFEVFLDGKQVAGFASPDQGEYRGSDTPRFQLTFNDEKPHDLRVEYMHHAPLFGAGITMEWQPKPGMLTDAAVDAAKKADVVVAFVGLSPELEGEEMPLKIDGFAGGDRTSIKLPEAQQKMLEALAATGKPLVVVLMNGSALAVNWAQEHAKAIVEAWYPGEAGGEAIADTLLGKNDPAGRLPITFYVSDDQLQPFTDYSMKGRTYRYFKGKPLYGFGYGMSYTSFAYSHLHLSTSTLTAGDTLTVEADVKNTGARAGDEVAEVYLTPPQTEVSPSVELAGFTRVHLAPGETRHLTFALDPRTLSQVDGKGLRAVDAGSYTLTMGGAQPVAGSGESRGDAATETVSTTFSIEGHREMPR